MVFLKEKNKKLEERTSIVHVDIFQDINSLRSKVLEQENLTRQRQEPIISQVQAYKPIHVDLVEPPLKPIAKGKGKAIGIQIN